MCGIAGVLKLDPREIVEETRLREMRDVLIHRGPDGSGMWIGGPVGLAHRRLAIVDVAGGHQPMSNLGCGAEPGPGNARRVSDGVVWLVLNGEIYNHAELRAGLIARGHRYHTRSDTETILHLYEEYGDACVERLRGMFAFALWDTRRRRLILARDRLGIKPLYWAVHDGELLFASEIKALLAGGVPAELNRAVLPELLANRYIAGAETLFAGIQKLLPGRMLTWSPDEGLSERRYWQMPAGSHDDGASADAHAEDLRERLTGAVSSHLMADVPLGVFLSGGLDSTGIAALATRVTGAPVQTFAVGFAEREANELGYARLAAEAIGATHHEITVSPAEFFTALPRLVWHEDEPLAFPSSVPLYFVSKLARKHVKVVLTGEGADELFLGYNRYRVTAWNQRLAGLMKSAPAPLRRLAARAARALPGKAGRYLSRSFLNRDAGPRDLYCENFAVFPTPMQRDLFVDDGLVAARDPYAATLAFWPASGGTSTSPSTIDPCDPMSRADMETYLVELLMKQDQMSMAASLESRVPYLDHLLVEHVVGLPAALKLRGLRTKAVLRDALAPLIPERILHRKKMGFPVPLGGWLRGPFAPLVDDLLESPRAQDRGLWNGAEVARLSGEHRSGARDHTDRLWMLMGLEQWMRIFIDKETPARLAA